MSESPFPTRRHVLWGAAAGAALGNPAAAQSSPEGGAAESSSRFLMDARGAAARTAADRLRESISLLDFIPIDLHPAIKGGSNRSDLSSFIQAAIDHQIATARPIFAPAGVYRIETPLVFAQGRPEEDRAFGLTLIGAGMTQTIFENRVPPNRAMLTITVAPNVLGRVFARGTLLSGFAIVGDDNVSHNGIAMQGCWFNSLINLRIVHCGGHGGSNQEGGIGLILGADVSQENPDWSAVSSTTLIDCEIRRNGSGISNPVNNNAPGLVLLNTNVVDNARYGLWCNSSGLYVGPVCAIAYNGRRDPTNAYGGIRVQERQGTTFSTGYAAKEIIITGCEIESNYPQNLALCSVEAAKVTNLAIGWRDWEGSALRAWPRESVLVGGATRRDGRAAGVHFDCVYWWVHSEGRVGAGPRSAPGGAFHLLRIQPWGWSVTMRNSAYQFDNEATAEAGGRLVAGSNVKILKEEEKDPSGFFHAGHYCDYDFPQTGAGSDWAITMFDTPFRKVFPGLNTNLHFNFVLENGRVKVIPAPTLNGVEGARHWGQFAISASGVAGLTGLFGFRAIAPPELYRISVTGTEYDVARPGPLTGRTGRAGALTLAVDVEGRIYIENRSGATKNITFSFLMNPGLLGQ